jgi:hypothetical protein
MMFQISMHIYNVHKHYGLQMFLLKFQICNLIAVLNSYSPINVRLQLVGHPLSLSMCFLLDLLKTEKSCF